MLDDLKMTLVKDYWHLWNCWELCWIVLISFMARCQLMRRVPSQSFHLPHGITPCYLPPVTS